MFLCFYSKKEMLRNVDLRSNIFIYLKHLINWYFVFVVYCMWVGKDVQMVYARSFQNVA